MILQKNCITVDLPAIEVKTEADAPAPFGCLTSIAAEGDVSIQDMYLPHFSVRVSKGKFSENALFINTRGEGLEMMGSCLLVKGDLESLVSSSSQGLESFNGSQNFKYDPNNIFAHRVRANHPFHIVHFSVHPEYLFDFLPENEKWAIDLRVKMERNESLIGDRYTPITLLQDQAMNNIFNCPFKGQLGLKLIETSIIQIMLIQLHSIFENNHYYSFPVSKKDADLAHAIKEHLSANFLDDHSLESLAKMFGTNTNKLMMLFKKTFNKSIFEYISELKMDYARVLLERQEYRVAEVASIVGYKNPNHFSAAFKKKFDISPSQLIF